jgi:predicted TIM-barrel fold metal-dependent hydrolase
VYEPDDHDAVASSAGQQPWHERRYDHLAEQIRRIGPDKIVFGTDWPLVRPADYLADLQNNVPLDADSWGRLLSATTPASQDPPGTPNARSRTR